jgi:hypothetical protein
MSIVAPVTADIPLSPGADGTSAPWNGALAGAQAPGSAPGAADLLKFQQTMDEMRSLRGPTGEQRPTPVPGVGPLQNLSNYLTQRGSEMAGLQERNIKQRDVQSALDLNIKMADTNFENELMFTAIGKTFSGITELTKLS